MRADNTLVMAVNKSALAENINVRARELNKSCMIIRLRKTTIMAVSNVYRKGDMLINGKPVEQVDNIKYLGTTIEQAGNIEVETNKRITAVEKIHIS